MKYRNNSTPWAQLNFSNSLTLYSLIYCPINHFLSLLFLSFFPSTLETAWTDLSLSNFSLFASSSKPHWLWEVFLCALIQHLSCEGSLMITAHLSHRDVQHKCTCAHSQNGTFNSIAGFINPLKQWRSFVQTLMWLTAQIQWGWQN